MARRLAIETVFTASDRATKTMDGITKKMGRLSKKMTKGSFTIGKAITANLASSAITTGLSAIQQGISAVVSEFKDFDSAITSSFAKFGFNLQENQAELQQLKNAARGIGETTEFSAAQAAQGLSFMAMAGFDANESMSLLPGVVDLATASNVDLARATDIASDALGAFGLAGGTAEEKAAGLSRVMDVMSATANKTNTDMESMFEAVKFGGPAFTSAGQDVETFSAILGRMASNSVKGSMAGTALRSGILRLAKPTKEVNDTLSELGVVVSDSDGNMRNMIDIVADLEDATKNMGNSQKNAALGAIFGKNAFSAWATIINEGVGETRKLNNELMNAGGSTQRVAKIMRESMGNQLEKIRSALIEFGFKIMDIFGPTINRAISGVSKFVDLMNSWFEANRSIIRQGFGRTIKILGGIIDHFVEVFKVLKMVASDVFEKLQEAGVIDNLVTSFEKIKEVGGFVVDVFKDLWSWLEKSGTLDTIVKLMKTLGDVFNTLLLPALKPLAKILAGVFKTLMIVLEPIMKVITFLLEGVLTIAEKIGEARKISQQKTPDDRRRELRQTQAAVAGMYGGIGMEMPANPGEPMTEAERKAAINQLESVQKEVNEVVITVNDNGNNANVTASGKMSNVKLKTGGQR